MAAKKKAGVAVEEAEEPPLLWKDVVYIALNSTKTLPDKTEDPRTRMTSEQKQRAFKITTRSVGKGDLQMDSKDVVFLLKRIDMFYPAMVYGKAKQLFEGWEVEAERTPDEVPEKPPEETKD